MRRSASAEVVAGIVTTLKSSTAAVALATGGIYNNVPQGTEFPYYEVTSVTERPDDTFGKFGSSQLVDVRAVSQYQGDLEVDQMSDAAIRALHFQRPTIADHVVLGINFEQSERFRETVNGIVTRHRIATFRVWTEQA